MTYATLCTGLGGFDAGFDSVGMTCVYQCEQDRDCLSVLRRQWPNVPKSEDVNDDRTIAELVRLRPDVIAFGSPCQDLSVAGRRGGLAAERSGLFFRCMECCFVCEAPWVVWENVPGVFSSQHGEDFASVLEAFTGYRPAVPKSGWRNTGVCIGPLYAVAWAVLDAQWFGVPQSRDRVFLVGHLGDKAGPYEVLSLAESVPWDSPPSRETRASLAQCLATGTNACRLDGDSENFIPIDMRQARRGEKMTNNRPGGSSGGAPGTGIGKPGDPSPTVCGSHPPAIAFNWQAGGGTAFDLGADEHATGALSGSTTPAVCIPFDTTQITSLRNYSNPKPVNPCHPLSASAHAPAIAYTLHGSDGTVETASETKVAGSVRTRPPGSIENSSTTAVLQSSAVRRLTPLECERLQGCDGNWTKHGDDGKQLSDSARYRMLGNAVCRNVATWIGRQLINYAAPRELAAEAERMRGTMTEKAPAEFCMRCNAMRGVAVHHHVHGTEWVCKTCGFQTDFMHNEIDEPDDDEIDDENEHDEY